MLKNLQREHAEWISRMYPGQTPDLPAAGMVEEAGELLHCALAVRRADLWGYEPRYPPEALLAGMIDAVGDCAIYACSYCNARGWSFADLDSAAVAANGRSLVTLAVDLVRIAAEFSGASYTDYFKLYIGTLRRIAAEAHLDYEECIGTVWNTVKERRR